MDSFIKERFNLNCQNFILSFVSLSYLFNYPPSLPSHLTLSSLLPQLKFFIIVYLLRFHQPLNPNPFYLYLYLYLYLLIISYHFSFQASQIT